MDAQNATEAASMKPSASSASNSLSSRNVAESDRSKVSSSALVKPSTASRLPASSAKDADPSPGKLSSLQSQPSKEPSKELPKSPASVTVASSSITKCDTSSATCEKQDDDGGGTDGNSEAETIVLSKDGSPAKPRSRKIIKHEDKRNGDCNLSTSAHDDQNASSRKHISERKEKTSVKPEKANPSTTNSSEKGVSAEGSSVLNTSLQHKKKRPQERQLQAGHHQLQSASKRASSSLSSAPASPPRSRQHSSNPHSGSDSDRRTAKSPMPLLPISKDRLHPTEKLVPNKRKAHKAESEDEAENRKARRQRLNGASEGDSAVHTASHTTAHSAKASKNQAHHNSHNGSNINIKPPASRLQREPSRNRSISPQPRPHRRSLSTQLPSQTNGLGLKKKRVPAPLQSTDYHSDESSASGSTQIRSSKPRSLTTPATADLTMSPAKIGPHKKHLDAHGQTFLARACARGEYDLAKQRLAERPEDLNVADFAGNTPLQIAAINGYGNIVKLLIDAGCNLDCVNYDKDTPLLDAVDNGHLEVVKLLLDAGVSPRKANVHGQEPLDRVGSDIENCTEIRAALVSAKKREEQQRRHTSEEHRHEHDEPRFSHGPDSPRRSPAPSSLHSTAIGRRAGTARATKTSNHLLYMPMDDKTLRLAAGRGDEETVTRILQVREAFDDPESMVAAARGGHDIVMQLLLALGRANPDPDPISSVPAEHATPMLAAIGQENLKVVNLLLEQNNFDPTRRFHGNAYYEIARQRAGPKWKEEEDLLKIAYDNYKKGNGGKDGKVKSPVRKEKEKEKEPEPKRAGRLDHREESSSRAQKHKPSSPPRERSKKTGGTKSSTTGASTSPREERPMQKRSENSTPQADGKVSPKRALPGPLSTGKHKRDDRSSVVSGPDRDTPPPIAKQIVKSKKTDQEAATMSSEGETVKPRRKLISGRELKDEKEKQRRASMVSTTTTLSKESTSPRDPRPEENTADKARAEKHRDRDRDRARQLKNEDSRDSASGTDGGSAKRHRSSETPPRHSSSDKDANEAPIKRRRLDGDSSTSGTGKEAKVSIAGMSSDDAVNKSASSSLSRDASKGLSKRRDEDDRKGVPSSLKTKKREPSSDRSRKGSTKALTTEKSIHVKSEDVDIEMGDVTDDVRASIDPDAARAESESRGRQTKEDERRTAQADTLAAEASKRKEEEAKRLDQEEEARRRREEEIKRKREEESRRREEEARKRKAEEEEKNERERRRLEEEERGRKKEERERREEEEKKQREEEERQKRAEEERLRQEQLAKEAAEEARRKREDDERRERERREREREEKEREEREREERERKRAEQEAEELRRRQLEEEERARISKLPALLQWLSKSTNSRSPSIAHKFRMMQGVRYDCIDTNTTGSPAGREQWLLNTQAALILGDKDLSLAKYPTWQHAPVSIIAKRIIWRLETDRYALTEPDLYDLGRQLPEYYGGADPDTMSYQVVERLRGEAWEKFSATDMFFVRASDVMSIVPSFPHLHNVRLIMAYRELPEDEAQLSTFKVTQKWKDDPDSDRFYGFAPRNKYYVNGQMVKEERPGFSAVSKTPFPEVRVPRRRGIVAVSVDDPDYMRLCKEQGIEPVVTASADATATATPDPKSPVLSNGKAAHSQSTVMGDSVDLERSSLLSTAQHLPRQVNGISSVNGIFGINGVSATKEHS